MESDSLTGNLFVLFGNENKIWYLDQMAGLKVMLLLLSTNDLTLLTLLLKYQ